LLVDKQWQIDEGKQSQYQHYSTKALNTSGVTEVSQFSINFDPVYESVLLHKILVHRDGNILDRKERSQINLIQREKDLDIQIYDGSKTLNVFIDDVRVGDTVEYSYTIVGANPIFSGHFSEILKMRWSVPIGRVHYRVLWLSEQPLHIRNHVTEIKPVKQASGRHTEYSWSQEQVDELVTDKDTPNWFDPFPVIYLSDIDNWNDVIQWALPLYQPVTNTPAQQAVINLILEKADSQEHRILEALRFVQDEVRYLGIEMGERSHKPNNPDAVIKQRFGDCKDKSKLLVSLLQGMGIKASSALVNTYGDLQEKTPLPTPTVFDHAIVHVPFNRKNYWLDPTRNYQRGNLNAIYQPDYDYALVISDQGPGLVKMSEDIATVHRKIVEETFDVRDAIDKPATYQILTIHEQFYADSLREDLSETNLKEIQQSYLNYTAQYYPDIKIASEIKITDNKKLNRLALDEQYTIQNIWEVTEDERYIFVNFDPFLIIDQVKDVKTPIRTMPYSVAHPIRFQHTTRILLPEGSAFEEEFIEVEDNAFYFTKKVNFSKDVLTLEYVYESLSDHVKPENIQAYSDNINTVQNLTNYQIQMTNPAINFGQYHFDASDVNWQLLVIFSLALFITIFLSYKFIYLNDPPYQKPDHVNNKLQGLSGWLILPGLALILNPIKVALGSRDLLYGFSVQQWSILEEQYGTGFLATYTVGMISNIVLVVTALFLIIMFFTARHTFPRLYITYFVFALVVAGADLLAIKLLAYPGIEVERTDIIELSRLALTTLVWSLYFTKSERVKATFIRQRNHIVPLQQNTHQEASKMNEQEYAGFWIRFGAFLIDFIIIAIVIYIPLTIIYGEEYWAGEQMINGFWDVILGYVVPIIATIWFWLRFFGTPGKMATKLKIVDAKTRGRLTLGQAIGRYMHIYLQCCP